MPQLRILVVEDDLDTLEALCVTLEREGYECIAVSDGAKAVDEAISQAPNVAIIDIYLGAMNGHDIARALRERFGGAITLIAITGIKRPSEHIAAMFAGFNHYLTKPYQRETLLHMLARASENA